MKTLVSDGSKTPVVLSREESEHVSGGAALNIFTDINGTPTGKETGSALHGNGGAYSGDHGAFNQNVHVANK